MTLREIGLSVGVGLAILILAFFFPALRAVILFAFETWYVGATALIAGIVVGASRRSPEASRVLGLIGIAWVTIPAVAIGMVLFRLLSSPGY
jgi:hypothetical protein